MTPDMEFEFFPLRFEFIARESLYFPPGKAGNIIRGALGIIFRRLACQTDCDDARTCTRRDQCAYAQVFEPSRKIKGPSGLSSSPRSFVFRARSLDGCTIQRKQTFHFNLHIFSRDTTVVDYFVRSFAALAHEGLGPGRGKAELRNVRRLALGSVAEQTLIRSADLKPVILSLDPAPSAPSRIRVEFLTPTELKHENTIAQQPDFVILFKRIRDRISTLRELYGSGPLDIDFRAMGVRAGAIKMTACKLDHEEIVRLSTRTGQVHTLGGMVGTVEYEGEMAEFMPYLEAAQWVGVGRHAVWGKGEIAVHGIGNHSAVS
jgi:hypothetical protein